MHQHAIRRKRRTHLEVLVASVEDELQGQVVAHDVPHVHEELCQFFLHLLHAFLELHLAGAPVDCEDKRKLPPPAVEGPRLDAHFPQHVEPICKGRRTQGGEGVRSVLLLLLLLLGGPDDDAEEEDGSHPPPPLLDVVEEVEVGVAHDDAHGRALGRELLKVEQERSFVV